MKRFHFPFSGKESLTVACAEMSEAQAPIRPYDLVLVDLLNVLLKTTRIPDYFLFLNIYWENVIMTCRKYHAFTCSRCAINERKNTSPGIGWLCNVFETETRTVRVCAVL